MIDEIKEVGESYVWSVRIGPGDLISYVAEEYRRNATGPHAKVSIQLNGKSLEHDTFNIGRSEERGRLARAAHGLLDGHIVGEEYSVVTMRRDLGLFCEAVPLYHEEKRFVEEIPDIDPDAPITPIPTLLDPYIVEGAGTVIFGAPGKGKTYTALIMALCLSCNINHLWPIKQTRPILFVNLERDGRLVTRRFTMVCRAFGITGRHHGVTFLHARGQSLTAIQRRIKTWTTTHPTGVVILDSISRSGQGSMNEDDTANRIVDILNLVTPTWVAVGHSPRADDDHQFGSIMFEAGQDIGVKLSSEERKKADGTITLGISLSIKKGNDIAKGQPSYLALDFQDDELWLVRGAEKGEFPKLLTEIPQSDEQKVIDYLLEFGKGTATEINKATGINRSNLANLLNHAEMFVRLAKTQAGTFYGLKDDFHS